MAIHDKVPGIEVTVEVDGAPLVEYAASNDQAQHEDRAVQFHLANCAITKYIECRTGKHFSVRMAIDAGYKWDSPSLGLEVWVDGVRACSKIVSRKTYEYKRYSSVVEGIKFRALGQLRPFTFVEIRTTSDSVDIATVQEERIRIAKVGEIMIMAYRKGNVEYHNYTSSGNTLNNYDNPIPEKALKGEAKSHGIMLGDPRSCSLQRNVRATKLDGNDGPIAIFKFKYRSKVALKQLLVIKRTPEPEYPTLLGGLSEKERREVDEFARGIKRKRDTESKVKLEDIQSAPKRQRSNNQQIIDLTEPEVKLDIESADNSGGPKQLQSSTGQQIVDLAETKAKLEGMESADNSGAPRQQSCTSQHIIDLTED